MLSGYPGDTEVWTNNGWKKFLDIDLNDDKVLTLNQFSNYMSYESVDGVLSDNYDGNCIHIHNQKQDLMLTDDQEIPVWIWDSKSANYHLKKVTGMIKGSGLVSSNASRISSLMFDESSLIELNEFVLPSVKQLEQHTDHEIIIPEKHINLIDWLKFFGFWLADGSWRDHINSTGHRDYTVIIAQRNNNVDYVCNLCESIGFSPKVYPKGKSSPNSSNICIYSKQLWTYMKQFGRSADKFVPIWILNLPLKYQGAFLNAYLSGDGQANNNGSHVFASKSKSLMEAVQIIVLLYYGQIFQMNDTPYHYKTTRFSYFRLNCRLNRKTEYCTFKHLNEVKYCGKIVNLRLSKNQIMLGRYHNRLCWIGSL